MDYPTSARSYLQQREGGGRTGKEEGGSTERGLDGVVGDPVELSRHPSLSDYVTCT